MLIQPDVRKCVLFVGLRMADGKFLLRGTAFFVGRMIEDTGRSHCYLVTARHVIEGIRSLGLDEVLLRANMVDGEAQWLITDIKDWHFHETGPRVDVAVMRANIQNGMDHLMINVDRFATAPVIAENEIGVGDEVFLTGLFVHHHGDSRNIPIVRVGNISAMPELPVNTRLGPIDAYLVEARSIGGLSGSPVWANLGLHRMLKGQIQHAQGGSTTYLLGVMQGHFEGGLTEQDALPDATGEQARVNMGIAIVVPIERVLEVIAQPELRQIDQREEAKVRAEMARLSGSPANE